MGMAMSEANIDRYRAAAAKWRSNADEVATAEERNNCLVLAEGYERLVEIIAPSLAQTGARTAEGMSVSD
jgi:hypothetical protein